MSNSAEGEATEEEDEEFYESLDRVLSSSCSSTSASDDDCDYTYRRPSRFTPSSAVSFDIWLSDPGSVEDRRHRLLRQMGLAGDPALARASKPDGAWSAAGSNQAREVEMGRSISCDGLCPRPDPTARATPSPGVIARSRSDGYVEPGGLRSGRPPLVGRSRPSVGADIQFSDGYRDFGDRVGDEEEAQRCTVKDLETGKEFVVKEFREDGMWNKLKEVGTGRQFTMEEFEMCVGSSPIVQELMRRQSAEEGGSGSAGSVSSVGSGDRSKDRDGGVSSGGRGSKKRMSWLKSLKNVVAAGNRRDRRSSDEKETSSEKGGRRSSSATDDSQDTPQSILHGPERMKVRHYGKSHKDLSGLFLSQEIQAHEGSIWTIRFSLDGRYLASAGEGRVIHVWKVLDHERKPELLIDRAGEEVGNGNGNLPKEILSPSCMEGSHWEKKRHSKGPGGKKSLSSDHVMVPEQIFALSERPTCSFIGHLDDVLDLSWSKAQHLLSSSMDKTVRLWHLSSNSCLKIFSHSDYVTCIQFNPIDDRYFISGSLDAKVRLWSIPDRQVVDWNELHEMITAACYTQNGQGALVGSHEGNCYLYDMSDNKFLHKRQIDLQNKKKKSSHKKITGFQCAPGSSSEVLITSADSRIRVVDGSNLIHKFKGFRNTNSQISASLTANGKYVICASEDSHVYAWRYDADTHPSRVKKSVVTVTESYENFHCLDVTVAVPLPDISSRSGGISLTACGKENGLNCASNSNDNSDLLVEAGSQDSPLTPSYRYVDLNPSTGHFGDRVSSTWPEEKLLSTSGKHSRRSSGDVSNGGSPTQSRLAWGMVIVAATRGGEIRIYQNFGFPVRV